MPAPRRQLDHGMTPVATLPPLALRFLKCLIETRLLRTVTTLVSSSTTNRADEYVAARTLLHREMALDLAGRDPNATGRIRAIPSIRDGDGIFLRLRLVSLPHRRRERGQDGLQRNRRQTALRREQTLDPHGRFDELEEAHRAVFVLARERDHLLGGGVFEAAAAFTRGLSEILTEFVDDKEFSPDFWC